MLTVTIRKFVLITVILTLLVSRSFAQARSSVGIGAGINQPLSSDYKTGFGFNLQGSFRVADKWAIVPALGIEHLDVKVPRLVYYGYNNYSSYPLDDVDVLYTGLSGKYYTANRLFVRLGATLYLGFDDDLRTGGVGGTAAAGYDVRLDGHSDLELTLRADVIDLTGHNNVKPYLGLRAAYNLNFRKL